MKFTSLNLFIGLLIICGIIIIASIINRPAPVSQMTIELSGDSLFIQITGEAITTSFTPGKHFIDSSSTLFVERNGIYKAEIPTIQRFFSFGQDKGMGFYHFTAGPFPSNYTDSLEVVFMAPGKTIFCKGQVFLEEVKLNFSNMFVAREFPICWAPLDSFNFFSDSNFVFFWGDSSGRAMLDGAKDIATTCSGIVPNLAPNFWEKRITHWQGAKYCTAVFLGTTQSYGLEHFNSPLVCVPPRSLDRLDNQIIHEMFHSFVGKAVMPTNYTDIFGGKTYTLGVYEGLTSFIEAEYTAKNLDDLADVIAMHLSAAKAEKRGLIKTSADARNNRGSEYYSQGFLFWLVMSQSVNIDSWTNWVFEQKLIDDALPKPIELLDIFYWLDKYQSESGDYAMKIYDKEYLAIAESLVYKNGFEPMLFDSSSYFPYYFGPYHVGDPPYTFTAIDTLGLLNLHPEYVLVEGDSLKMGWYGPGTKLVNQYPDSVFQVVFSYGPKNDKFITLSGRKRTSFPDGSRFFFQGKINLEKMDLNRRKEAEKFWQGLLK